MDSGNSGSLQSSSGGDEEYDSRAASFSTFLANPPSHIASISQPPPPILQPPPLNLSPAPPPMFDSLSSYLHLQNHNPSSLFNPNMNIWSKTLRSEPNSTHTLNPIISSSSPLMDSLGGTQSLAISSTAPAPDSGPSDNNNHSQLPRNPKKRSRASRRAPITVLTTDTTNFRAMVQEFTGIPEPPFQRSRVELFGMRSSSLDSTIQPPYLRRPFPQKIQPPPAPPPPPPPFSFPSSSSLLSSPVAPQSSSLLTTLLQSTMKFSVASSESGMIGSRAQDSLEIPSNDLHIRMGGLDEYARNGDQVQVSNNYYNLLSTNSGNGKINVHNYLGNSSSSFHGEKGPESVAATRGEGMVESWICSSD